MNINEKRMLWLVLHIFIIYHATSEPVNNVYKQHETVDFNEKLDYNKIKMSKLRLLLLGELFKQQQQQQQNDVPTIDLNCESGSSSLYINTKNCPCKNMLCKDTAITSNGINTDYNHRRNIFTSCKDFCCTKFKRSISNSMFNQLYQTTGNKYYGAWNKIKSMCGRSENVPVPYVMHRKGNEPLCTGVFLSSTVILTTARCVYHISLQDLAIKIEHPIIDTSGKSKVQRHENGKFIRKMVHGLFKPELGQNEYDVALLVMDKEVKMSTRTNNESTSNINSYLCLPKGNLKIENSLTNCYVTMADSGAVATRDQFEEVKQLQQQRQWQHNQNASHAFISNSGGDGSSGKGSVKIYMNVYKATECDKIVQIVDQQKFYLHNGSICGVLPYSDNRKSAVVSGQIHLAEHGNQQLLGGLPLICSNTNAHKPYESLGGEGKATPVANYFTQGLLTRYWPEKIKQSATSFSAETNANTYRRSGDNKSAFVFVNVAQYVDWINLQMEKLYLHNYS